MCAYKFVHPKNGATWCSNQSVHLLATYDGVTNRYGFANKQEYDEWREQVRLQTNGMLDDLKRKGVFKSLTIKKIKEHMETLKAKEITDEQDHWEWAFFMTAHFKLGLPKDENNHWTLIKGKRVE